MNFSPPPIPKEHNPVENSQQYPRSTNKLMTPAGFENFFPRPPTPFNFYPHHLLTQPLNFSNRPSFIPGAHHHNMMSSMDNQSQVPHPSPQNNFGKSPTTTCNSNNNDSVEANRNLQDKNQSDAKKVKLTNAKKIDRIAENLRYSSSSPGSVSPSPSATKSFLEHFNQIAQKSSQFLLPSPSPTQNFPMNPTAVALQSAFLNADPNKGKPPIENLMIRSNEQMPINYQVQEKKQTMNANSTGNTTKIPNSKLFAKCFICSKLLSNQYNLRVHLETHQNMR